MERIDDLQLKGLRIIQNSELFCFGTDAVLLADFASPKKGARIADLGTGTGILPLLLYGRQRDITVDAIEIQEKLAVNAQRSVELNGLCEYIRIVQGDIRDAYRLLGSEYDMVVVNPPYDKATAAIPSMDESHQTARFETKITWEEICKAAQKLLRSGGKFCMIHRVSRLVELFETLRSCRLEPKEMRLIHSSLKSEPACVLISATKDGRPALKVLPPLIVHEADGSETVEVKKIYHRNGEE
ncbi:MAG: tRNA1(Val) (adenine(37)-N6)-methyltransferase [Christensenella sp.]|uniref:tRNA1(Val) (adenine(37)-N6)-methyltransferase n=1 Tax=Christensenella sp. TaxID=1935934 RepID=UPI002B1FB132|nr:tRNA1(Val) (adenine(37)-N6)-methyltransferase [Christensenella sp.]MEA5003302.1 tRNA1(Val) (adenine(37)-N6)-methyltransferase [Christensenella sp.]